MGPVEVHEQASGWIRGLLQDAAQSTVEGLGLQTPILRGARKVIVMNEAVSLGKKQAK